MATAPRAAGRAVGQVDSKRRPILLPALLFLTAEIGAMASVVYGLQRSFAGRAPVSLGVGRGLSTDYWAIAQALAPLPFIAWSILGALKEKKLRTRWPYESLLLCFVPMALGSLFVGLAWGNPNFYVLGDLLQLLIFPATYFALKARVPREEATAAIGVLVRIAAVLSLAWLALELYYSNLLGSGSRFSTSIFVIPLFWILLKKKLRTRDGFLGMLMLVGIALSFKRALYASLLLVVLLYAFRFGLWRRIAVGIAVVATVLTLWPGGIGQTTLPVSQRLLSTWVTSSSGAVLDQSTSGRLEEVSVAIRNLWEGNNLTLPPPLLTGFGLGALIEVGTRGQIHHIHATWVAFLYRTGLVGLFVALGFLGSFLFVVLSRTPGIGEETRRAYLTILAWTLVQVIPSFFSGYIIWKDYELGAAAALLAALLTSPGRRTKTSQLPATRSVVAA